MAPALTLGELENEKQISYISRFDCIHRSVSSKPGNGRQ